MAILLFGRWVVALLDRTELGPRTIQLTLERVSLDPAGFAPLRLAGAWRLSGDDPRLGGVSALAVDRGDLIALTDSGAILRFATPGGGAGSSSIRELFGGPGDARFKSGRDSEALLMDPAGRGGWVAFENRNQLWLYDAQFNRALRRIDFGRDRWPRNRGIEGLTSDGASLLLFPERGNEVVELRGTSARRYRIERPAGRISDAARLPSGDLLVVNRHLTALGFANSIALLKRTSNGFRYGSRIGLGVSPLDNIEAVAPEILPGGGLRLWLMTDDNFQRPLRTLLIALDWPVRPPRPSP